MYPGGEQRVGGAGGGDQVPGGPLPPASPIPAAEAAAPWWTRWRPLPQPTCDAHGTALVWCSDEFYLLAGRPLPEEDYYEEFTQLDNGVGMLRLLRQEFRRGLDLMEAEEMEGTVPLLHRHRRVRRPVFNGIGRPGAEKMW